MVGQAGKPKTITGFQTHTTPVLLAFGERAELATEECKLLMIRLKFMFIYIYILLNLFRFGCNTDFGRLCNAEKESCV